MISAPPSQAEGAIAVPDTSPRLLVLSDSPQAGQLLERLVRTGYTVMLTSTMGQAVRLVAEYRPMAVLTHLRNPTDHLELARRLDADARTRHVPALPVRPPWKPTRTLERLGLPPRRRQPA